MNRPARARSSGSASVMSSPSKRICALGDLEVRVAHDRVRQGRLARAVGAHQRVDLALVDGEVQALEDLLVPGLDVEVLDLEVGHVVVLRVVSGGQSSAAERGADGSAGLGLRARAAKATSSASVVLRERPDDAALDARPQQLGGAALAAVGLVRAEDAAVAGVSSTKQAIGATPPSSARIDLVHRDLGGLARQAVAAVRAARALDEPGLLAAARRCARGRRAAGPRPRRSP